MRRWLHALAAPYALDALEAREVRAFERHMLRCATCAEEVRALRQDALRLGAAVATPAPEALRERVLTAVRSLPQEPAVPTAPAAGPASPRVRQPMPWTLRLAAAGAALSLAAAIVLAVQFTNVSGDLDRERAQARAVQSVLGAPDADSVTSQDDQGGRISAVVSREAGRAVVSVANLPAPANDRVHQLWAMEEQPGEIRSAGLLDSSEFIVAEGIGPEVKYLAVTDEPLGGSAQPTSDPLTQLALPGS